MTVGADHITLNLITCANRVADVQIVSNRTTMAARILEGKKTEDAASFVPLLFSLCGTAQHQAALSAFEEALGYVISPAHRAARRLLLLAEGISEHVTRILIDWAALAGLDGLVSEVRQVRDMTSRFKTYLFGEKQGDKIGGAALSLSLREIKETFQTLYLNVQENIFACPPEKFAQMCDMDTFSKWLIGKNTIATSCLHIWNEHNYLKTLWPTPETLIDIEREELIAKLDDPSADIFVAKPIWEARPRQTGPLTRHLTHPLIRAQELSSQSYFIAKLVDLAQMMTSFEETINDLERDTTLYHTKALYKGYGQVEAVRGQLSHRIWLHPENDTIARYRILAPTEWNFHHDGILKNALLGVEAAHTEELKQIARICTMALDPCVACRVVVEEQN